MMKKKIVASIMGLLCFGLAFPVFAKPVTGTAFIEGNVDIAREKAKKDAMRNFVEQEIGVNVNSQTEMVNFMVVKDVVSTRSDGFIVVKKVISESNNGSVLTLVLDLEHGAKPFELAPDDIAAQLENLAENSSRNGIDVAIVDKSPKDTSSYNLFLQNRLNKAGFRANINDPALSYLRDNMQLDDITLNAGVRVAARQDRFDSNAIVRGRIDIARQPELVGKGLYRAVAEIACQIISYDNNAADSVSLYVDGMDKTPEEAIRKAKQNALSDAVMELAKSASKTIQRESRGSTGMGMTIKTVLIFGGLADRSSEPSIINQRITDSGCRIIRSGFNPKGEYQVFVAYNASADENANTLAKKIWESVKDSFNTAAAPQESNAMGSVKYIINLRG